MLRRTCRTSLPSKRTCPTSPHKPSPPRRGPEHQSTTTGGSTPSTPCCDDSLPGWKPGQPILFAPSNCSSPARGGERATIAAPLSDRRAFATDRPPNPPPSDSPLNLATMTPARIRSASSTTNIVDDDCARASWPSKSSYTSHSPSHSSQPCDMPFTSRATVDSTSPGRHSPASTSSSASWPLVHRWVPPSSSSEEADMSSRTRRFSATSSYAFVPSPRLSPLRASAPSTSALGPTTSMSQAEMNHLLDGIDFDDDLEMSSESQSSTSWPAFSARPSWVGKGKGKETLGDRFSPTRAPLGVLTTSHKINSAVARSSRGGSPRAFTTSVFVASSARTDADIIDALRSSPAATPSKVKKDKPVEVIDLRLDVSSEYEAMSDDDDSIEIVESAPIVAPPMPAASQIHRHWFVKPDSMKTAPAPALATAPAPRPKLGPRAQKAAQLDRKAEADRALRERYKTVFDYRKRGNPAVVYTDSSERVAEVLAVMDEGPYGFDLEWDPSKRRGIENKTALAQICDGKTILLVHIAKMQTLPPALKDFVEDSEKVKLGVQIGGDAKKLVRDYGLEPKGLLELNNLGKLVDGPRYAGRYLIGLQEMTATYLNCYLPKESKVRCGQWSGTLSPEQRRYAANDVWASLLVYRFLETLVLPDHNISSQVSHNSSSASSHQGPLGDRSVARGGSGTTSSSSSATSSAKSRSVAGSPTPRQREAYSLYQIEGLTLYDTAIEMSQTKAIKSSSVLWHLLSVLGTVEGEALKLDKERLWTDVVAAWDEVSDRFKEANRPVLDKIAKELGRDELV